MKKPEREPEEDRSFARQLEEKSLEIPHADVDPLSSVQAGPTDISKHVDRSGNEVENGPDIDPDDPNLSEAAAEAGAQNRKSELGLEDEDEMRLGNPDSE